MYNTFFLNTEVCPEADEILDSPVTSDLKKVVVFPFYKEQCDKDNPLLLSDRWPIHFLVLLAKEVLKSKPEIIEKFPSWLRSVFLVTLYSN